MQSIAIVGISQLEELHQSIQGSSAEEIRGSGRMLLRFSGTPAEVADACGRIAQAGGVMIGVDPWQELPQGLCCPRCAARQGEAQPPHFNCSNCGLKFSIES